MKLFYMGRHEAEPTNKGRRRAGTILPVALAFVLVLGAVAFADQAEGDIVGPESLTKQVTAGSLFSLNVDLFIKRQGQAADSVTWTGPALSGNCSGISGTGAAAISLPTGWSGQPNGTLSKDLTPSLKSTVTVSGTAGSAGAFCSLAYTGMASNANIPAGQRQVAIVVSFVTPANTAPTLDLPGDFTVEGNTSGGANVTYLATATDAEDGSLMPSCSVASGSFFALGGPHTVNCSVTDSGGLSDSGSFSVTVVDTTPPDLPVLSDVSTTATGNSQAIVTYETPLATDIVDTNPQVICLPTSGGSFPVGSTTVTCVATDASGNSSDGSDSFNVVVSYDWSGFFRPIDNLPTVNRAKAGSAVPVKFSLAGNQGLGIFYPSYPKSVPAECNAAALVDAIEETVTAGGSSLSYDATSDQYVYVWKTDKWWANTCRQLQVKLADGTMHIAMFNFTK